MSVFSCQVVNFGGLCESEGPSLCLCLGKAFGWESCPRQTVGTYFHEGQFQKCIEEGVFEDGEIEAIAIGDGWIEGEGCNATVAKGDHTVAGGGAFGPGRRTHAGKARIRQINLL